MKKSKPTVDVLLEDLSMRPIIGRVWRELPYAMQVDIRSAWDKLIKANPPIKDVG